MASVCGAGCVCGPLVLMWLELKSVSMAAYINLLLGLQAIEMRGKWELCFGHKYKVVKLCSLFS